MKRILITIAAFYFSALAFSHSLPLEFPSLEGNSGIGAGGRSGQEVGLLRYAGPFPVKNPVKIDEKDVSAKQFDESNLLDIPIKSTLLENGQQLSPLASHLSSLILPGYDKAEALHLIGFNIENKLYTGVTIEVKGIRKYQLFVDGKKQMSGYVRLEPTAHQVVIKYLSIPEKTDTATINVEADT